MNLLLLLILIVYFNIKYYDRFLVALQILQAKNVRDFFSDIKIISNLIYSNLVLLCFFTISVILIVVFIILVFKKKPMYFTKLIAFVEFVFYVILFISIVNFIMEPSTLSDLIIYSNPDLGVRLFSVFLTPFLLLLFLSHLLICLFHFLWRKKKKQ